MYFKPLVTLLAIVNPLACLAFFIHYTQSFSPEQRRHTILISSCSAFAVIAASALLSVQILEFFGVSLASFQVGGCMLLLLLTAALSMLNAETPQTKTNPDELHDAEERAAQGASIAVLALAVELMADGLSKLFPVLRGNA